MIAESELEIAPEPEYEPDYRGPAAIAEGSILGGYRFTGPFDTIHEAHEWYKKKMLGGYLGLDPTIVLLNKPVQQIFPSEE